MKPPSAFPSGVGILIGPVGEDCPELLVRLGQSEEERVPFEYHLTVPGVFLRALRLPAMPQNHRESDPPQVHHSKERT